MSESAHPGSVGAGGEPGQGEGSHSLALGLCVGFGGCVEAAQLCPVIGRDCRRSTGRGVGEGRPQARGSASRTGGSDPA